jgi:hypothetical protein
MERKEMAEVVRLAVAETQGWRDIHVATDDDLPYFDAGQPVGLPPDWKERDISFSVGFRDDDDVPDSRDLAPLPAYLTDPAAWGALMEKEGIAVSPKLSGGWAASWAMSGILHPGDAPGEAVCAAVLAKHNAKVES